MATKKKPGAAAGDARTFVALLRGINVGGNKKVPMAELRELAEGLGWQRVATYIQSGNVVFCAKGSVSVLEERLEQAIERHFGFAVPVIVVAGSQWAAFAARSPFAAAETERPNLLHLGVAKAAPRADAAKALSPYCTNGERVVIRGGAIWIDFPEGVGRSKVTPAVLDRTIGSTVTLRNWKTVQQIAAMLRAAGGA
ncbi:MAG TPA: DUF1697 domain-containing protein [Planctomycetota bacterium]|nr:DUF1697 domain-containing protein [Planctomycetota bacterium]